MPANASKKVWERGRREGLGAERGSSQSEVYAQGRLLLLLGAHPSPLLVQSAGSRLEILNRGTKQQKLEQSEVRGRGFC